MKNPHDVLDPAFAAQPVDRATALQILRCSDAEVLDWLHLAAAARRHWFGNTVKLNYLVNLRSGKCPEDCTYCSQRLGGKDQILRYSWLSAEEAGRAAQHGLDGGARRVCLVASGRGPSNRDVERVGEMIGQIKADNPRVEVCACLGILKPGQAEQLAAAGADAYNHNLNTAQSHYPEICTTHDYADRVQTVDKASAAGLSPCSGVLAGLGESPEQLVDVVFALRELRVDSVPVNFLLAFDGTPLADMPALSPLECLRILIMVRLVHPDTEVRIGAGREEHLRSLQSMALHVANSVFLGDYLTSEGQGGNEDLRMIKDAGFVVSDRRGDAKRPALPGGSGPSVRIRRRGAGTQAPANA